MNDAVALVTCGPAEHGISRFGRDLAGAAAAQGFSGPILHVPDPHRLVQGLEALPAPVGLLHLQCNDWLFTDSDHRADESIRTLAAALRGRGGRLSLTLHDLPHPAVPRDLFLRRARAYVAMTAEAVTVVVSSEHERLLLEEAVAVVKASDGPGSTLLDMAVVKVIPLPVAQEPVELSEDRRTEPRPSAAPVIGILGYIYPGKGHREVIEALTGMSPPVMVLALGRPSDGHEAMLAELVELGRDLGTAFTSTGFVPDHELTGQLRSVAVPLAPAPHVSASASINTWIAAGRRPLVLAGRYTQEIDARMPGAITLYRPGELHARVRSALANPSQTYLPRGFRPYPDRREVAARYLRWLRSAAAFPER